MKQWIGQAHLEQPDIKIILILKGGNLLCCSSFVAKW